MNILEILLKSKMAITNNNAKRLIWFGVIYNGEKITDPNTDIKIKSGDCLKVGRTTIFFTDEE